MKITRKSNLTGTVRTKDINVDHNQIEQWEGGELIQNVMPDLSPDEREFMISGITPEEWEEHFGVEEE